MIDHETTTTGVTVVVVDDDERFLDGLVNLLSAEGFRAIGFNAGAKFLAEFDHSQPSCLVLDYHMPDMDGVSVASKLAELSVPTPIIMLTGVASIPLAVDSMRAGVVDFLEKPFDHEVLLRALHLGIQRAMTLFQIAHAKEEASSVLGSLTSRELEIFKRVVRGHQSKSIAAELDLSIKTVEMHRSHMMRKLGASSLADLISLSSALNASQGKT